MNTSESGYEAESVARRFLEEKGLELVERNFRCKAGEIDLIMTDGDCLVFVEVRLRHNPAYGTGAETITHSKIQKLIRTAEYYLQRHPIGGNWSCRFDVISMGDNIDWIPHAFTLDA